MLQASDEQAVEVELPPSLLSSSCWRLQGALGLLMRKRLSIATAVPVTSDAVSDSTRGMMMMMMMVSF